ncbi:MAG TPA: hypothetical protein VER55_09645 [Ardenticatenaceae bacterium]|nr:hypothetical protein [Ardenticatenaceae bacterium]
MRPTALSSGAMTRLVEALQELGLYGHVTQGGRWVELQGERCLVYVVEARSENGYYSWCGCDGQRTVEFYRDPIEAIRAGLQRARA